MLGALIYWVLSRREQKHAAPELQSCGDINGPAELMADSSFKKAGPNNVCPGEESHELAADVPAELENTQSREHVPPPVHEHVVDTAADAATSTKSDL